VSAKLDPIIVVSGSDNEKVKQIVTGTPAIIVHNLNWQTGQGSSIRLGVKALPKDVSACLFFMCDQPHIKKDLVQTIINQYHQKRAEIIAPRYRGQRGNPVLFDRCLFHELETLLDKESGRSLFSRYPITYVKSEDDSILFDVDTLDDYEKLKGIDL